MGGHSTRIEIGSNIQAQVFWMPFNLKRSMIEILRKGVTDMAIIRIKNITKHYGNQPVLTNYSLDISEGSLTVIYGAPHSGKTTLLRMMALADDVSTGDIQIGEYINPAHDPRTVQRLRRHYLAHVEPDAELIETETVAGNLAMALAYVRRSQADKEARLQAVVEQFELVNQLDSLVKDLAMYDRRRLSLARSLLKDALVLLADDPTRGLAANERDFLLAQLRHHHQQGATVVIATADDQVVDRLADYHLIRLK